jgi:hypothetical protein
VQVPHSGSLGGQVLNLKGFSGSLGGQVLNLKGFSFKTPLARGTSHVGRKLSSCG